MPLTWEGWPAGSGYTMTTVPELVKIRDDPWAGMSGVAQSLHHCWTWPPPTGARAGDCRIRRYPRCQAEQVQPSRDTDLKETRRSNAVRLAPPDAGNTLVCPHSWIITAFRDHRVYPIRAVLYRGACERYYRARVVANAVVGEDLQCGDVQGGDPRVDAVDHVSGGSRHETRCGGCAIQPPSRMSGVVGVGSGVGAMRATHAANGVSSAGGRRPDSDPVMPARPPDAESERTAGRRRSCRECARTRAPARQMCRRTT